MVASPLCCRKFCKSLIDAGFKFNQCDPCAANKIIKGKKMTTAFHVDDCKLSHKNPKEMDDTIKWLREECKSVFEDGSGKMSVSRGKAHTHLGVTLDSCATPGQAKVTMIDCIKEIPAGAFDKAEPNGGGTKISAAPADLFKIDKDCKKLKTKQATELHNLTAKTLHATKRARPDTCPMSAP